MTARSPVPPNHWLRLSPIAHRGLHRSHGVPENSLGAFRNAMEAGCPIEMDVRLLADGQVVVFHDSDLQRTTGQGGRIAAQTSSSLRRFRLFGTGERVPLLGEALALVDGRVPVLIDIKSYAARVGALERAMLSLLEGYGGEFALQSFNPWSLRYVSLRAPAILIGQLSGVSGEIAIPKPVKFLLENVPPYWLSRPHFASHALDSLPHWSTTRLRASGTPLLAWTIRSAEQRAEARRLADNYIFEG